ncbi:PH domain-containing protein [Zunongwangia sp. F260]|uniref:PH domain-containing protein n=2 Tax=Autumnicola TaxID=3160927 RepID=A0ABU3CFU4_9FLAO|nr:MULTISPECIES: PH domain-containing protein [unclassified Zunongwangia]MDT0645228.1 PH domain-containing protein [Zunongwangia sp. F260]MDT0686140.1 PH domain-containing protein [Zunongwangia sp. F225]
MSILSSLLGNAGAIDKDQLQADYGKLLIPSETLEAGFKIIRDTFIFTNKRLIIIDVQGLTGRKIEYFSVIYKSISRFSVETAGSFDLDAELKIWISGEQTPSISKRFNKKVDIYEVQKLLAEFTL